MFSISAMVNTKTADFFCVDPLCVVCDDVFDDRGFHASSVKRKETMERLKNGNTLILKVLTCLNFLFIKLAHSV